MQLSVRRPVVIKYTLVVFLIFLLLLGTCVSLLGTHAAGVTCANPNDTRYQVRWGDTLGSIAAQYHVSLSAVEANNSKNIPNPNLIYPFQIVCIPSMGTRTGGSPQSTLPTPVLPQSPYVTTAQLDAGTEGLPVQVFTNQMYQESRFVAFNADGTPLTSPAGAIGIAQFLPSTAAALGINPADPNAALKAAAHLDRVYLTMMYNGNIDEMLAAYNAGPGDANAGTGVAGAVARCGIANFRSCLPTETENYIHAITGN